MRVRWDRVVSDAVVVSLGGQRPRAWALDYSAGPTVRLFDREAGDDLGGIIDDVGDLIVVTGPPGAGKSTVSSALSCQFEPCGVP